MQDVVVEEEAKIAEEVVSEVVEVPSEPEPEVVSEPIPEPTPAPTPEPMSEPVVEEPVEAPTPEEPVTEPAPAVVPETLPVVVPTPPVVSNPETSKPAPEAVKPVEEKPIEQPKPASEPPKDTNGIPQKVLDLTPDELDAARRLWAVQNIKSVQAKSAHDRTARRDLLLSEIEKYIKSNSPATLSMIAYHANISPRKASDYLRTLVHSKRIQATGNTSSRRYS